jgi:hypothetical protein
LCKSVGKIDEISICILFSKYFMTRVTPLLLAGCQNNGGTTKEEKGKEEGTGRSFSREEEDVKSRLPNGFEMRSFYFFFININLNNIGRMHVMTQIVNKMTVIFLKQIWNIFSAIVYYFLIIVYSEIHVFDFNHIYEVI